MTGSVVVSGSGARDLLTRKYASADGAVVWERRFDGPAPTSAELPDGITQDRAGNILVLGESSEGFSGSAAHVSVVKYSAVGDELWRQTLAPESYPSLFPRGIVEDSRGALIVTAVAGGATWNDPGPGGVILVLDPMTGALVGDPILHPGHALLAPAIVGAGFASAGVASSGMDALVMLYSNGLAIEPALEGLGPVACGIALDTRVVARNASGSVAFSLVAGALPPFVSLATDGAITGTPTGGGTYDFTVRVQDGSGGQAERQFQMHVFAGGDVPVAADPLVSCQGDEVRLFTPVTGRNQVWLPGGENSVELFTRPTDPALFGVQFEDTAGCLRRGARSVWVAPAVSTVTLLAPTRVHAGSTRNRASVSGGRPGAVYSWQIQNGVVTAGAGSSQIEWTAGAIGVVTLSVRVGAAQGCTATRSAQVTVIGNQAPTATSVDVATSLGAPVAVDLVAADPDGDPLTFAITRAPAHGSLTGTAPALTYQPAPEFHGADSFAYSVTDGFGGSASGQVTITISANRIRNGSFESGRAGWKRSHLQPADTLDCTLAGDGHCSHKMTGAAIVKTLKQVLPGSGPAGSTFTLRASSMAQSASPLARASYGVFLTFKNADGTQSRHSVTFTAGTHGWETQFLDFAQPKAYRSIVVQLGYGRETGTAWFDDIQLERH